jgi:hypothetical protein
MTETKRKARADVGTLAERMRKVVDEGADTAEEIHRKVLNLPLDLLERNGVLGSTTKDLRRFQDETIGVVYDLVRGINHEVAKFANDVLGPRTVRRPRARKRPAGKGVSKAKKTVVA